MSDPRTTDRPEKGQSLRQRLNNMLCMMADGARCLSMVGEPFLYSGPGKERYSWYALVTFFGTMVLAGEFHDVTLYRFAWIWFAMLVFRRFQVFLRWRRGERIHSHCLGYPWLAYLLRMDWLGGMASTILCFAIGLALMPLSQNLGKLWFASGAADFFLLLVSRSLEEARLQSIFDQQEELNWMATEAKKVR